MKRVFGLLLTLLISTPFFGQNITQTIRGEVIDVDSRATLIGANVVVLNSDPFLGASADINGKFKIENVPVGRHHLKISFLGYEDRIIPNVEVESGKELVLVVELTESFTKLKEVEITATEDKAATMNEMATVSARTFSVEETQRYAGGFDDPARMAQAYAGVTLTDDGLNEIVVRGNSPRGLLWRLEGIQIPNPNHFSEEGASGGGVSALNSNMMSNSDFFTGAFPSDYGNAMSGVFDMRLRKGNNEQREYALAAGVLGTDFAFEGPFKQGGKSSYLLNYRYSTLSMLNYIGVDIVGDAVPVFQDLSFNFSFPTEKYGHFTLFGIGGLSNIDETFDDFKNEYNSDLGIGGLTHTYRLNASAYIKTVVAMTATRFEYLDYELDDDSTFFNDDRERFVNTALRSSVTLNKKIDARNNIRVGAIYSTLGYDLFADELRPAGRQVYLNSDGTTGLMQGFASWKWRIASTLTLNSGIHYTQLVLNNQQSVEPRVGLKWQFAPTQNLTAGVGLHSRHEALSTYFAENATPTGITTPNKSLDFSKARHYVLGYDNMLTQNLYLKTEVYYQDLYNIPVERDEASEFSSINASSGYTNIPLKNTGTGYNYGLETTLEKYFSDNYYFLVTASLFNSRYKGSDGVEHHTRYNGQYAGNILAGKEFPLGKNKEDQSKQKTFSISIKSTLAGGRRFSPIDLAASIAAGRQIRDNSRAFEAQADDYFRADLQLKYSINRAKTTQIIKLDIQNVANRENHFNDFYDESTQSIQRSTQLGLIPVLSYKIKF